MSDLQTLAATLLVNFTTVRIPRLRSSGYGCGGPAAQATDRLLSRALACETFKLPSPALNTDCWSRVIAHSSTGSRAVDQRMAAALLLPRSGGVECLHDVGVGECGLGMP